MRRCLYVQTGSVHYAGLIWALFLIGSLVLIRTFSQTPIKSKPSAFAAQGKGSRVELKDEQITKNRGGVSPPCLQLTDLIEAGGHDIRKKCLSLTNLTIFTVVVKEKGSNMTETKITDIARLMMVTREINTNSQHNLAVTNIFYYLQVNASPPQHTWSIPLASLRRLQLTFSSWCGRYVYCDAFTVCQTGLYSQPVVCDVKLEFYYLCYAVVWELLSYLVLEKIALGREMWFCSFEMGSLSEHTSVQERGEERRGAPGKQKACFPWFVPCLGNVVMLPLLFIR